MTAFVRAPKLHQYTVLALLAFCHRALRDPRGAVRYMELAAALRPDDDGTLYNLAILQKCDGRLEEALRTIARARALNPEHWGLQCLEAGYLVLNGRREEGMRKFAALGAPRGEAEFHQIMRAWFCAVSRQREAFYLEFTKALESARTTGILEWIDQDVDLDAHRNEPEFKALVEKHAARLRNPPLAPEPKEQP
jgi:tetratricopeptide (TPR) repeat protein